MIKHFMEGATPLSWEVFVGHVAVWGLQSYHTGNGQSASPLGLCRNHKWISLEGIGNNTEEGVL